MYISVILDQLYISEYVQYVCMYVCMYVFIYINWEDIENTSTSGLVGNVCMAEDMKVHNLYTVGAVLCANSFAFVLG